MRTLFKSVLPGMLALMVAAHAGSSDISLYYQASPLTQPPWAEQTAADACSPFDHGRYGLTAALPRQIDTQRAARFDALIEEAARQHRVPAYLIHAIVATESAYDPDARSPKGARGLMQLMPDTARRFGANDIQDPRSNLDAGTRYLRWLMERFDHELPLVLAAYNAGEGSVQKYANQIPPYPETRNYVAQVMASFNQHCTQPGRMMASIPSTAVSAPPPAAARPLKTVADALDLGAAVLRALWMKAQGG